APVEDRRKQPLINPTRQRRIIGREMYRGIRGKAGLPKGLNESLHPLSQHVPGDPQIAADQLLAVAKERARLLRRYVVLDQRLSRRKRVRTSRHVQQALLRAQALDDSRAADEPSQLSGLQPGGYPPG